MSLAGLLAIPDTDTPSPGVVMVGGSGHTDRNNDTYFPPIREHLLDAGIAVLSYDKRGVGTSTGDWRDTTIDDLAADASAALDFLRTQPGVRPDAAGLFGHSEGGWVVLHAAASRDDVPWVITNSCPGTSPAVQERHALAQALRHAAAGDAEATLEAYDHLCEAARRDADIEEAIQLVRNAPLPQALADYTDEHFWRFTKGKQDHDPIPDTQRLRCPHLAIFGTADPLIPVADSIRLFSTAACDPDRHPRATLTIELFPHADHRIQAASEQPASHQAAIHEAASDVVASDQAAIHQPASHQVASGLAASDQAAIDQAAIDQAAIDQAAIDQAAIDQAAIDQAAIHQAASQQAASHQTAIHQTAIHLAAGYLPTLTRWIHNTTQEAT